MPNLNPDTLAHLSSYLGEPDKLSLLYSNKKFDVVAQSTQTQTWTTVRYDTVVLNLLNFTNYQLFDVSVEPFGALTEFVEYKASFFFHCNGEEDDEEDIDHRIYTVDFKELYREDFPVSMSDRSDDSFLQHKFDTFVSNQPWSVEQKNHIVALSKQQYNEDMVEAMQQIVNMNHLTCCYLKNFLWMKTWFLKQNTFVTFPYGKQHVLNAVPTKNEVTHLLDSWDYTGLSIINLSRWQSIGGIIHGDGFHHGKKGDYFAFDVQKFMPVLNWQHDYEFTVDGKLSRKLSKTLPKLDVTIAVEQRYHTTKQGLHMYEITGSNMKHRNDKVNIDFGTVFYGPRVAFDAKAISSDEFVTLSLEVITKGMGDEKKYFYCIRFARFKITNAMNFYSERWVNAVQTSTVIFNELKNPKEWVFFYPQIAYYLENGNHYAYVLKRRGQKHTKDYLWFKVLLGQTGWSKNIMVGPTLKGEEESQEDFCCNFLVSLPTGVCMIHTKSYNAPKACNVAYLHVVRLGIHTKRKLHLYRNNVFKAEFKGVENGLDIVYLYCFRHSRVPVKCNCTNPFHKKTNYFQTYSVKKVYL